MKLKRIVKRFIFHLSKSFVKLISYFDHRLYMKLYIPLLKKNGMKITGIPRYIGVHVSFDDFNKIKIGDRVVISDDCHFLTHDYSITTALIAINKKPNKDIALVRGITVGENVFIGKKTIVMPNTQIGNNVIIGAGSVVRGVLESNSIYLGNPAQKIGNIEQQANKWKKYLVTEFIRIDK